MALRYAVIDGCPVPKPLYPILRKLKKETGCTFNSVYRGDDVASILHKHGKHTQRELFETLPPGVANPPDRGTHILLGDGVVGKLHQRLPWWRCGIDINDWEVDEVIRAAKRHGWKLYQPYPSGSEFHHVNFAKRPKRWRAFFRNVFKRPRVHDHVPASKPPHKPPRPPKPPKPQDHLGEGIDVSEHQGDVDWKKVGNKVKVGICKATEGRTFVDSRFNAARLKAMEANVRAGVYHFARPDNNNAQAEVKHFVRTVRNAGGKFISFAEWKAGKPGVFAFLDFEQKPFNESWAAAWGAWFEKETGVKAGIYGGGYSLNPVLGSLRHFSCVWIAAYVSDWHPYFEGPDKLVAFWQSSSSWSCPGVSGGVDHNLYVGD